MQFHTITVPSTADKLSWFKYYKFRPEDEEELYYPLPNGSANFAAGDVIWFVVGGLVLGGVQILRVEDDPINERQELWYRGTDIVLLEPPVHYASIDILKEGEDLWERAKQQKSERRNSERTS